MLRFFGEWSKDERVSTKMSSLSMDNVPSYISSCFTKWSTDIIKHGSTIGNQICLSDLTIQHLASYYGHRGGKRNLGTHRTAEHRANISMALSGKVITAEHRANISMALSGMVFTGRQVQSTSGLIISQEPRRSLTPKGECRVRELVMLRKEAWENGLRITKKRKEEPIANVKS
jgi:hypothetical protein